MTAKLSDPERDQSAHIVALFSVLIHAWQTNDFHEAARARDELEQLGIKVQMPRRRQRQTGVMMQVNNKPTKPVLLLTPQQAAEALAISPRKLWGMTASGEIPHARLGRCVRYPVDDLQRWINDQTKGGNAR